MDCLRPTIESSILVLGGVWLENARPLPRKFQNSNLQGDLDTVPVWQIMLDFKAD
jgi:hypothetical protein